MNRDQRRKYIRQFKNKGVSSQQANNMATLKTLMENRNDLEEGAKVRFDIKKMRSSPDWPGLDPKWKQFAEEHKDTIFTVEYDPKHRNNPSIVSLKEDVTDPKWLWWTGYLVKI